MHHLPTYKYYTHVGDRVALGRIGPSFLNPEKQPVFSEDGKRMVVFEGELFDPSGPRQWLQRCGQVLRDGCDAEIALHAFEEAGSKGIAQLAGAYVGCFYDSQAHACHLFTDRLGLRGCYYCVLPDGTFLFASEMKGIAAVPGFTGHMDLQAAAELLNKGCPFFERTLFEEVKFLPHGSVVCFSNGHVGVEQYWDMPRLEVPADWRFEDAVEEGSRHLIEAVRKQFRQQGRIGAFLSGGRDSRAIVAACRALGYRIPTFTLRSGHAIEERLAGAVANKLGLEHHSLTIAPDFLVRVGEKSAWYSDAMLHCAQFFWVEQLPHIQSQIDLVLSGCWGDIFVAGGMLKGVPLDPPPQETVGLLISKKLGDFSPFLETALMPKFRKTLHSSFKDSLQELVGRAGGRGLGNELIRAYLSTRGRRDINVSIGGLVGIFLDVKYPLLGSELLDFCTKWPLSWRAHGHLYNAILSRAFPQLVGSPYMSSVELVPRGVESKASRCRIKWRKVTEGARFLLGRLSTGRLSLPSPYTYLHYDHWYRTTPALREWVRSILLENRTLDRGYYDREGIKRLLHLQMTRGYVFSVLANLLTFEYWNRFFVDRQPPPAQTTLPQTTGSVSAVQEPA